MSGLNNIYIEKSVLSAINHKITSNPLLKTLSKSFLFFGVNEHITKKIIIGCK